MTAMDKRGIKALAGCTFLPGEFNKRFAGDLEWARQFTGWISEKQRACLWRLIYRYRRQILQNGETAAEQELIDYAQLHIKLVEQLAREDAPGKTNCAAGG